MAAFVLWLYVFFSGPWQGIAFSFAYLALAIVGFWIFKKMQKRTASAQWGRTKPGHSPVRPAGA